MNPKLFLISDWWEVPPENRAAFLSWHNGPYRTHLGATSNVRRLYAIDGRPNALLSWNEGESDSDDRGNYETHLPVGCPGASNEISHERFRCELMRDVGSKPDQPTPWLYIVHTDIPDHIVDEYTAWYDEEHLPRLVTVPGVLRARRFVAHGSTPLYLTAYDLTDRDAFESPAGIKARKTPWTEKMRSLFYNTRRSMAKLETELR